MPTMNILACLFNGSKGIKKGKYFMSRLIYPSILIDSFEAEIKVNNAKITLDDVEKNGWTSTVGAVVLGRRIDRTRTTLPSGWTIEFNLSLINEQLTKQDIFDILKNAGFVAGLGDSRPSSPRKPGPYGRFEIQTFESI